MKSLFSIFLISVSVISMSAISSAWAGPSPADGWEKISDDDGIEVYKKEIPDSPIIAFRGEGMVNAPIAKVAGIIVDETRATEWMDRVEETKVLRRTSDEEYVRYSHVGTPIVMKDRDFVVRSRVVTDPKTGTLVFQLNSVDDPAAPKTDYVRGEIMDSSFTLKSLENHTKTYVITEIHADPKGGVAKWIVNLFQKSWPRNTIEGLRKQAAKPDIQEHPKYKKVFSSE